MASEVLSYCSRLNRAHEGWAVSGQKCFRTARSHSCAPAALGDPTRILEVISNLLSNAIPHVSPARPIKVPRRGKEARRAGAIDNWLEWLEDGSALERARINSGASGKSLNSGGVAPRLGAASLALALLGLTRPCLAEPSTSLLVEPAPPGDAGFLVGGADARGHAILRARVLYDYAAAPLALVGPSGKPYDVVERQSAVHALVSFSLFHRVLVYGAFPLVLETSGDAPGEPLGVPLPSEGAAPGDARLGARVRLLGEPSSPWQLAASLEGRAPTGKAAAYASDGTLGVRALLSLGARSRALASSLEFGFRSGDAERFGGVLPTRVGSALELGASVQLPVDRRRHLWVGPEAVTWLTVGGGASLFDPRSTRLQFLVGGRYRPLSFPLELHAALGPGLGSAPGSPDTRVLAGLAWVPEMPAPPPDRDKDGVPDATDVCLNLPGVPSNDPLMHGCPEEPLDTDEDGIPDAYDACPRTPGIPTAARRTHGCPKVVESAPPLPPPTATVTGRVIEISEQVQFETGTAVILRESAVILREIARVIAEHPEIRQLEVAGHTDDTGTPEFNQRLSLERASAVLEWLVTHGIERKRLIARGYGQSRPIAENATETGKAKNRRVEFHILERTEERK